MKKAWNASFAKGFEAGKNSILRKNKSGCCCKFAEDGETILELCDAHKEYIKQFITKQST